MKKIFALLLFSIFTLTQNAVAQCENTDAGNFPLQALEVCASDTAFFEATTDFILDDDDVLVYMVHENPILVFTEIVAIFPSAEITKTLTINEDQTYYVSAVAGNEIVNNGTTTVDFSDPCIDISATSDVVFWDATHDLNPFEQLATCNQEGGVFFEGIQSNYTFLWSDGSTFPYMLSFQEGFFTVTITSNNGGCENIEDYYLPGDLGSFPQLNNTFSGGTASCGPDHDYYIGFTFISSFPPLTYAWTTPSGELVTTVDENELVIYEGGEYCVTVTDANACQGFACIDFAYPDLQCASIEGSIVKDDNDDCISDTDEILLDNQMVRIFNEDFEYFDITDATGNFSKDVLPGTYQVQGVETSVWNACPPQEVILEDEFATVYTPLVMQAEFDCPLLSVDLASGLLRRCMDSQYGINYCNEGTIPALGAYIDLSLDESISIGETSLPFTTIQPGVYRFDLGDLAIGQCGAISIDISVLCSANNGQALCSQATIYPNDPCMMNANWNGASVEVTGDCTGDEIIFNIENIGTGNMDMPSEYIVIEDGVILMTEPIEFELDAGQNSGPLTYLANGSTYILQAMQVPNHPGMSTPTVAIEGCGMNEDGTTSTGFVTQFYLNESDAHISEDCREVTGSYDPNDKTGFPRGYGDNHYIDKGQDLEYVIRFQNTGNDTAFTVRIDDVLAAELDITTLRAGASSHPYELNIRGADTLEFLFENILLPDSFVNEVASHGFVQFKIAQKTDLELGTIIENTANIYFDFNEAIVTNTTFHELGEKFIDVTSTQEIFKENLQAEISPNPIQDKFQLSLSGIEFRRGRIDFFDVNGRMIYLKNFTDNQVSLQRNGLSDGLYFYKIHLDGEFVASGKVIFTP